MSERVEVYSNTIKRVGKTKERKKIGKGEWEIGILKLQRILFSQWAGSECFLV